MAHGAAGYTRGMDGHVAEQLRARGEVLRRAGGRDRVRVSLHYPRPLDAVARTERRKRLQSAFADIAATERARGLELDPASLSVSAQSVEGTVPLDEYDALSDELEPLGVRMRLVRRMKLV
jgi:hypothetical protein